MPFSHPGVSYAAPTTIAEKILLVRAPPIRSLISPPCTFVGLAGKAFFKSLPLFVQDAASLLFPGKETTTPVLSASLKKSIIGGQGHLGYMMGALWRPFICLSTERRHHFPGH